MTLPFSLGTQFTALTELCKSLEEHRSQLQRAGFLPSWGSSALPRTTPAWLSGCSCSQGQTGPQKETRGCSTCNPLSSLSQHPGASTAPPPRGQISLSPRGHLCPIPAAGVGSPPAFCLNAYLVPIQSDNHSCSLSPDALCSNGSGHLPRPSPSFPNIISLLSTVNLCSSQRLSGISCFWHILVVSMLREIVNTPHTHKILIHVVCNLCRRFLCLCRVLVVAAGSYACPASKAPANPTLYAPLVYRQGNRW